MNIINLTPHTVNIVLDNQIVASFPSAGMARCATLSDPAGEVAGIPIVRQAFGPVSGLPEPAHDTLYIVSMVVAQHPDVRGRDDVVAPNTSAAVRDAGGAIIGVPGFSRY